MWIGAQWASSKRLQTNRQSTISFSKQMTSWQKCKVLGRKNTEWAEQCFWLCKIVYSSEFIFNSTYSTYTIQQLSTRLAFSLHNWYILLYTFSKRALQSWCYLFLHKTCVFKIFADFLLVGVYVTCICVVVVLRGFVLLKVIWHWRFRYRAAVVQRKNKGLLHTALNGAVGQVAR